jgi:hypothetical protein
MAAPTNENRYYSLFGNKENNDGESYPPSLWQNSIIQSEGKPIEKGNNIYIVKCRCLMELHKQMMGDHNIQYAKIMDTLRIFLYKIYKKKGILYKLADNLFEMLNDLGLIMENMAVSYDKHCETILINNSNTTSIVECRRLKELHTQMMIEHSTRYSKILCAIPMLLTKLNNKNSHMYKLASNISELFNHMGLIMLRRQKQYDEYCDKHIV